MWNAEGSAPLAPRSAVGGMSSGEEDDASASESGEDEELHLLLGAFASYHRVQKQSDVVPEGVNVRFGVGGRDARVFASRTSLEFEVNRWDADELGSSPVVHTWDLTPAAADRLNRELLPAALREAATREGLVVSNRGGYHSTPDFLSRLGAGAESPPGDGEAEPSARNPSVPVPAARFLSELIRAVALETGKPGVPSGGGRKRKAPAEARDENENEKKEASPPHATVTSSWVNVSRSGDTHGLHHHAGALWSGVYYVSAPEAVAVDGDSNPEPPNESERNENDSTRLAGRLALRACSGGADPSAPETQKSGWCVWTSVTPKPGRLVLFPSRTLHGVLSFAGTPGREEPPRVSVAFNTGETKPAS